MVYREELYLSYFSIPIYKKKFTISLSQITSKSSRRLLKTLQHTTRCSIFSRHLIQWYFLYQVLQGHGSIKPLMNCQLLCLPLHLWEIYNDG